MFFGHLEETPEFLKMRLARAMIAKFCQKVKDTLNQDRISPSNHASKNRLAVTIITAIKRTPRAVEDFIGQTARAAEGISTISGSLLST
jgi:hypothetical protein